MEVRPLNNKQQSNKGLRLLKLPEAEDGHMVCATLSDYVVNLASRTFLPPGASFQLDVASVLNMLVKDLFKFAIFVKGKSLRYTTLHCQCILLCGTYTDDAFIFL